MNLESAIRVDMVGLPEKSQELTPKTAEPPAPAPVAPVEELKVEETVEKKVEKPPELPSKEPKVNDDAINLKKTKTKQKAALEKLKALSALEKFKQEHEDENKKKTISKTVKGNVLAPGESLTGLNKIQNDQYMNQLERHIRKFWMLPEYIQSKNLKGIALVQFDEQGKIVARRILKSSGNSDFDDAALAAIDKAEPFPIPPEKFQDQYKINGLAIHFPE